MVDGFTKERVIGQRAIVDIVRTIKMLSVKETKGLTEMINKIVEYLNGLKESAKQKVAIKVIMATLEKMLKKLV